MDILTLIGLTLGLAAILGGQFLEGGHASSLLNGPAMLIVVGGTLGAVMLQSSLMQFVRGIRLLGWVFFPPRLMADEAIERVISWSNIARKEGLLGLEAVADIEQDEFARKGLQLLVDGNEPGVMRTIMEVEVDTREQHDLGAAKLYESMGGYSPTIGIIGAVMGLIQVMENLSDPSKLGHGIAVAFVATIYGVGLANLVFIPIANKLKSLVFAHSQFRYMMVEGIVSIAEGDNPRNIEAKLQGFVT
ncbi:MAG: flagellar motor protein [Chromatiales bacterium]|nr:flagellar motor protein [Chromatiales bacterium]